MPMPSLGFLKKKRTREGNTDASPASNPTSPVTPTTARAFDQSGLSLTQPQPAMSQPASQAAATAAAMQDAQRQATDPSPHTIPQQPLQPYSPTQHTPSPGTDMLPSISNLIHPSNTLSYQQQPQGYPAPHDGPGTPQQITVTQLPLPTPGQAQLPTELVQHAQQQAVATRQALQQQHALAQQQAQRALQLPLAAQAEQHSEKLQQAQQAQKVQEQAFPQQYPVGQPEIPQDQVRKTKGKYTLQDFDMLRTLGTGSFGRVHLVQSKHNQRFYAVKVLKKAQVVKMKQVEHTNDERRMLGEVKHPFLITLWGTFQDARNLYMVMDFVEGGELFSLLRKSGRFPNPVAKFYAAEVTLALEYLHGRNIIYRDLKPENLLLDRHGHLKITDFGFAKRVPDKTWTLCGTPDYLAPEVVSNKGYNKSVDWWSLGILIYEMLCGYTPFWDSTSPMKIYENILRGKIKYPAYINPDAQDLLERLITADLTKRLGNLFGGSQDVKKHPWFAEVTWERLEKKDIDAPYTPPVKAGAGDASQFDRYPEETERYGLMGHDEYGHLFQDF